MGAGCSVRGHSRVAPHYPGTRRVLFCGMGRSGKSTLKDWVLRAANATNIDDESMSVMPQPLRTKTTNVHVLKDETLAFVDTPDMLNLDGQTLMLDSSAENRVAAIVFVVDVTDHLRSVLAMELLRNTLKRLHQHTRPGVLALVVGNHRHTEEDVLVDLDSFKEALPSDIAAHYDVRTMSFTTAQDVSELMQKVVNL